MKYLIALLFLIVPAQAYSLDICKFFGCDKGSSSIICEMFCSEGPEPIPDPKTEEPKPEEPKPDPSPDEDCHDEICEIESLCLKYTNDVRARNGKDPVSANDMLTYGARQWSEEMARTKVMKHDPAPKLSEREIKAKYGVTIRVMAENVAWNQSSRKRTPDEIARKFVIEQWENSPGHFRNMIGNYQELGCGIAFDGSRYWATQLFR